jgi:hypothetical protein
MTCFGVDFIRVTTMIERMAASFHKQAGQDVSHW